MDRADRQLSGLFRRHWLLLLFRGVAAIAFGISAWLRPGVAFAALLLLIGAYALVDGTLAVVTSLKERGEHSYWWVQLVTGVLGIVVGLAALSSPVRAASALLVAIAIWAMAAGISEIVLAIVLRRRTPGEWRVLLSGIASLVVGIFFLARPDAAAITVHWILSTYAIFAGGVLVALAFKTRSLDRPHVRA